MQQWSLDPVFDSYAVVITTVVLLLCTFLLVRPRNSLSVRRAWVLLILRCLIVLILALAMLRPSKTISELQTKKALVMFLVDETQSMTHPSIEPEISRWEHQQATWDSVHRVLDARADDVSARLFGYTDTISENRIGSAVAFSAEPLGMQTDLGTSLYEAVMTEPGRQIHAVVLMGDGTQTSYRPQIDMREAISVLRNMGIALITVPFGREGDTLQARDVSIEQLPQQYRVFSGNDVSIDCLARLKGVANRPLRVQLLLKSEDESMVVQETIEIVADKADEVVPVRFQWTAKAPGQYQMAVKIETVDGELLLQNNTQTAFLTVLEGGLRVLYFYGNRLGEQLELRRSLGSSPDIELLESYIRHGKNPRWPDPRTNTVLDGDFDLIIIEDVHSKAFGQANLQAIADAVEQGKGLMMVGGYYSFGPGGYRQTPVDAALPIEMEIFEKQEIGVENPIRKMFHLDRELTMRPTGSHPVTSISSVTTAWNDMPVLLGANRFQEVKSFGKVLLETGKQEPLLVSGQYGL
ncbi:MAG: glutamine amidotransferase, partial [Pirellulaceae bacterium]|nr:glutamine amidotransferase [Pirellulaceae bacterium]